MINKKEALPVVKQQLKRTRNKSEAFLSKFDSNKIIKLPPVKKTSPFYKMFQNYDSIKNRRKISEIDCDADMLLKGSSEVYDDYLKIIKPKKYFMDILSPHKAKSGVLSQLEKSPKKEYEKYLVESMHAFKANSTRLEKSKIVIEQTKYMLRKYF